MSIVVAIVVSTFGTGASAQGKRIGMKRAQEIASSRATGLILKAKVLEREKGKWIYSFEFRNRDGSVREVNVDAYTGEIVSVEHEKN